MRKTFLSALWLFAAFAAQAAPAHGATLQLQSTFTNANLSSPYGAAVNAAGDLFVTDVTTNLVVQFNAAHQFVATLGSGALSAPLGITTAPNGTLYVLDANHHRIQPMSAAGVLGTPFGSLGTARGVGSDANSNLYVADSSNNQILKYSPSGALLMTIAPTGVNAFSFPADVAVDASGTIYVADAFKDRVQIFDSSGNFLRSFSTVIPNWNDTHPKELVIRPDGSLLLSLGDPGFVLFANDGTLLSRLSGFDRASGVAYFGDTLYGVEFGKNRIAVMALPEPGSFLLAALACLGCIPLVRRARNKK